MRIVVDTNVLVSAIVFGGLPGTLVELAARHEIQLVVSPPLIAELRDVLHRKFRFADAVVYQAETLIRRAAELIEPRHTIEAIEEDPPDNRVLEAAVEAGVEFIVSSDRHLLAIGEFQGIPIVTPRVFFDRLFVP